MPLNRKKQFNKLLRKSPSPLAALGVQFQVGKKAGEKLAETVLGPIDYTTPFTPEEVEYQQSAPSGPPALEPPYQLSPLMRSKVTRDVYGQPSAPVDMSAPVVDFPYDPKDQDKVTRDVARHGAVGDSQWSRTYSDGTPAHEGEGGQHYLRPLAPPTDPMDTGGLDRGDPTSFAPPTEELEPAWVKRERERDRKRLLSQTQRQLRKR